MANSYEEIKMYKTADGEVFDAPWKANNHARKLAMLERAKKYDVINEVHEITDAYNMSPYADWICEDYEYRWFKYTDAEAMRFVLKDIGVDSSDISSIEEGEHIICVEDRGNIDCSYVYKFEHSINGMTKLLNALGFDVLVSERSDNCA